MTDKNIETIMELKHLEKQITEIGIKVDGILSYLRGNELNKDDKGLIGDVNDHDKRLAEMEIKNMQYDKRITSLENSDSDKAKRIVTLERWRDRAVWMGIGMALPAGYGIWQVIAQVLSKN